MTTQSVGPFRSTHRVPDGGLQAWSEPDGSGPSVAQLDPDLPVELIERRGDWAEVRCSNGWQGWVDARQLRITAARPQGSSFLTEASVAGVGISAALGAVLVVVGSLLPWYTVGSVTTSAWHVPVKFVITGTGSTGVNTGPILLVVVLVLLPVVLRRALPFWVLPIIAAVPAVMGLGGLIRGLRATPSLHPGVGLILVLAGAVLILLQTPGIASFRLGRRRT